MAGFSARRIHYYLRITRYFRPRLSRVVSRTNPDLRIIYAQLSQKFGLEALYWVPGSYTDGVWPNSEFVFCFALAKLRHLMHLRRALPFGLDPKLGSSTSNYTRLSALIADYVLIDDYV